MQRFVIYLILFFSSFTVCCAQVLFEEGGSKKEARTKKSLVDDEFYRKKEDFDRLKTKKAEDFVGDGSLEYELRVGPPISLKYHRGSFLIYDCISRHFACVRQENYADCEKRVAQETENQSLKFSCAPLRAYTTQEECFKKQKELVHRVVDKSFCFPKKNRP